MFSPFGTDYIPQLPTPSPLITVVLQSAVIACFSNTVAQSIHANQNEESLTETFSWITLLRFLALDLITAPPNYKWQEWLERAFPARPPAAVQKARRSYEAVPLEERDPEEGAKEDDDGDEFSDGAEDVESRAPQSQGSGGNREKLNWRNTFAKWFIDCITVGAIGNTLAFLIIMGILKGQSPSKIGHNIRYETLTIIWNGYKIWPIANFIAHTLVPWEKKIVWFAFVGLCWNVYLSLVAIRL